MAMRAVEYSKNSKYAFMNSPDRYYNPSSDFKEIAANNNYSLNDLRSAFNTMELFIKDKSKGYQYSNNFKGKHVRFYVLRKVLLEQDGEINSSEAVEFDTDVVSPALASIERLSKENKELQEAILNSKNPSHDALLKLL